MPPLHLLQGLERKVPVPDQPRRALVLERALRRFLHFRRRRRDRPPAAGRGEGVVDFEWCPLGDKDKEEELKIAAGKSNKKPKENTLAYWTPEVANQPARVTLMQFPSRNILRQKNLFNVSEVCVLWSLRSFRINM